MLFLHTSALKIALSICHVHFTVLLNCAFCAHSVFTVHRNNVVQQAIRIISNRSQPQHEMTNLYLSISGRTPNGPQKNWTLFSVPLSYTVHSCENATFIFMYKTNVFFMFLHSAEDPHMKHAKNIKSTKGGRWKMHVKSVQISVEKSMKKWSGDRIMRTPLIKRDLSFFHINIRLVYCNTYFTLERIYIRKCTCFFPLLATTESARTVSCGVFSLQFFEIEYIKRCLSMFFHINPRLIYFNTYFTAFLKTAVKYIFNTYFTL